MAEEEKNFGAQEMTMTELIDSAPAPSPEVQWEEEDEYTKAEYERLAGLYEDTIINLEERSIVEGTIVSVDDREAVINVGAKSEGVIPVSEFRNRHELKPGDTVEVYLQSLEDKEGHMRISRRMATAKRTWEKIINAMDEDVILEGLVKRRTKGGFVVDLDGIEAFLPGSQIDVKPIRDYDYYVGQRMEFKVVKINHQQNNVVISHKALIEKDLEEQKARIINNLEKGQVLEGVVKNITNFGVFIDLGGVDGLLHITDISWGRISSPEEVLSLDERLNVVVLDFDDEKKRISLGLKQLMPHPWDNLPDDIHVGATVKGKVVTIADYGIFIEIMPGVEGLIHVSEMSWSKHLQNPNELFEIADEIEAVVLTLDREDRKMSLGIKQLGEDPWSKAPEKYPPDSKHRGVVRNITGYGLFVELEEGVDGFIHVQDLSWSKKINHPKEFTDVGQELDVIVLELDVDERKLRLGHRQLTEDPWKTLETVFFEGSEHKGLITKMLEKNNSPGAIAELEYGIEGYIPQKHLKPEDGKTHVKEGDTIDLVVIEFNKDNRRIVLSHTNWWKNKRDAENEEAAKAGDYEMPKQVERGTLGELDALQNLRTDEAPAEAPEAKTAETESAEATAADASPAAPVNEANIAPTETETPPAEAETTVETQEPVRQDAAETLEATDANRDEVEVKTNEHISDEAVKAVAESEAVVDADELTEAKTPDTGPEENEEEKKED